MIISLQGTSRSGKTTTCRVMQKKPNYDYVPEIINTDKIKDDLYFLKNDILKHEMALNKSSNNIDVIIDRDFTSTLAFVLARDGEASVTFIKLKKEIDAQLKKNLLKVPDLVIRVQTSLNDSIYNQPVENDTFWSDKAFVLKFEKALTQIIDHYIPNNRLREVHSFMNDAVFTSTVNDWTIQS